MQAPASLIAEMSAQVIPSGSTSQTSGDRMSTALPFAAVPLLWRSTRKVTRSPARTCTLSVSGGLAGPPFTFATPLTMPIGGGAAMLTFTRSRCETVPVEVANVNFARFAVMSGAGPTAGAPTMADSTASKTAPLGANRNRARGFPITNRGFGVDSSTVKGTVLAPVATADPAS